MWDRSKTEVRQRWDGEVEPQRQDSVTKDSEAWNVLKNYEQFGVAQVRISRGMEKKKMTGRLKIWANFTT